MFDVAEAFDRRRRKPKVGRASVNFVWLEFMPAILTPTVKWLPIGNTKSFEFECGIRPRPYTTHSPTISIFQSQHSHTADRRKP